MTVISIDIETYSHCDLTKKGADNYARHPTTGISRFAYAVDMGPVKIWHAGEPIPKTILDAAKDESVYFASWNDSFESAVLKHTGPQFGFPDLNRERWIDAAAFARALAIPGGLQQASSAPWFTSKKSNTGHSLMMKLCKPDSTGKIPKETADQRRSMDKYCIEDVRAQREIMYWCGDTLTEQEHAARRLTNRMNARGFAIDMPVLATLQRLANNVDAKNKALFSETLDFRVTQLQKLKKWLHEQIPEHYDGGKLDKDVIQELLDSEVIADSHIEDLLKLRSYAAKTSLAKLDVAAGNQRDGRLRDQFIFRGAGQTGRYSARAFQPQNLIRETLAADDLPVLMTEDVARIEAHFNQPLAFILPQALRLLIVAGEGKQLVGGDYSQIESRLVTWVAKEQWAIDAYRDGRDIYVETARRAFGVEDVDDEIRQASKTLILSMGFAGGANALIKMGRKFGREMSVTKATLQRDQWREANPNVVACWAAFNTAAVEAVRLGNGAEVRVDEACCTPDIRYALDDAHEGRRILFCTLPSGLRLAYHRPHLEYDKYGKVCVGFVNWRNGKWRPEQLYGGYLFQNIIQGLGRDIMMHGMLNLEAAGLPPVLTIHDEIISEADSSARPEQLVRSMVRVMVDERPAWAADLPLTMAPWTGDRYQHT